MNFSLRLKTFVVEGQSFELFVPEAETVKEAYQRGAIAFPYWSRVWPAAEALAAFIIRYPDYIHGKRVMELGAGLGLPSIVAASYAASVICSDYVPDAVSIVAQTVRHLQLHNLQTAVIDWRGLQEHKGIDVLLLSDINYEPEAFKTLTKVINNFLQNDTTIILSTPQRLMAKPFIVNLSANCIVQEEIAVVQESEEARITVLLLKRN